MIIIEDNNKNSAVNFGEVLHCNYYNTVGLLSKYSKLLNSFSLHFKNIYLYPDNFWQQQPIPLIDRTDIALVMLRLSCSLKFLKIQIKLNLGSSLMVVSISIA